MVKTAFMPDNDPKKRLWYSIERKRLSHERWAVSRMHTGLKDSIKPLIENLFQFGPADALTDITIDRKALEEAYQDVYGKIGAAFAEQSYRALKSRKDEDAIRDQWLSDMSQYALEQVGERIRSVEATTLQRLRREINIGITEGWGIEKIAREIQSSTAIHRVRARTIARTEIVSASNRGSLMGAESTGLQLQKEWISTRDGRTREDHVIADGQTVDHNADFNVGGENAEYPGDPVLSPGNVINCRCAVASIPYD